MRFRSLEPAMMGEREIVVSAWTKTYWTSRSAKAQQSYTCLGRAHGRASFRQWWLQFAPYHAFEKDSP